MFRYLIRYRTIILAIVATLLLIAAPVWIFDVPWQDMRDFLIACLTALALIIAAAFVVGYLLRRFRR